MKNAALFGGCHAAQRIFVGAKIRVKPETCKKSAYILT